MEISRSQIRANRVGVETITQKGGKNGQEGKHQIIQKNKMVTPKSMKKTGQG